MNNNKQTPRKRQLITINTSNLIQNTNRYRFTFPNPVVFKDATLSVEKCSVYHSTYNISSELGNNTFQIDWPSGTGYITTNFTIPDGYYSVDSLNLYIQFVCTSNLYYMLDSKGEIVYFYKLSANASSYKIQLDIFPVPTQSWANTWQYTKPTEATWNFPIASGSSFSRCPRIAFGTGLQKLLGFTQQDGYFPSTGNTNRNTSIIFLSEQTPRMNPIFAYLLTCNLINSDYNQVPNILTQIPMTETFGKLIVVNPAYSSVSIQDGQYGFVEIQLLDQDFRKLNLLDPDFTLNLILEL